VGAKPSFDRRRLPEIVGSDEGDAAAIGDESLRILRHPPRAEGLDPPDHRRLRGDVTRDPEHAGRNRAHDHQIFGARPPIEMGGDGWKRLPRPRRRTSDFAEARQPRYDRSDEHGDPDRAKHAIESQRQHHHGRGQSRQGISLDARGRGVTHEIKHHRPDHRRHQPERRQALLGRRASAAPSHERDDQHHYQDGLHGHRQLDPGPDAVAVDETAAEAEDAVGELTVAERRVEPSASDPPRSKALRHAQVPRQNQHADRRHHADDRSTRKPSGVPQQPCGVGEPHEQQEIVRQQTRRREDDPSDDPYGARAVAGEHEGRTRERQSEQPGERVHAPFGRVVERRRREREEHRCEQRDTPAAEVARDAPQKRQRQQRAGSRKHAERGIARAREALPAREQQIVERWARVGERDGADHTGEPRRRRLGLEIAAEGRGGDDVARLYEITQRRLRDRRRMLETMTGRHREREDLVAPESRLDGEPDPQRRGHHHHDREHQALAAERLS